MNAYLLSIGCRYLAPLLILLSLVLLYRGHNLPGGGFIGGLMAASAILLVALANGWEQARKTLRVDPVTLMIVGLALAVGSGMFAWIDGSPFMEGRWLPTWQVPLLGKVKLGTPLLFDVGVYLTVVGFALQTAFALGRND